MALRAPPQRHAAGGRRARPRRSAPRTAARASRVPSAISRGDGDRDRGERFVEAAPKEANAKASRRDEKNTALSRAVLKTALALAACAAPHVVPLATSTGISRAGVSAYRHFAASAAERTSTGEGAPAGTRPAEETKTKTKTKTEETDPEAGVDYPFVSSRDVSSRELDFRNWLADVRVECARRGVREATIAACFDGLEPYPEPEPAPPPAPAPAPATPEDAARARAAREQSAAAARKASENKVRKYVKNMVSRDRVERGAALLLQHAGVLGEVEREYGVPGEIIVAIWGIESSFGGFSGNTDCVEALANIAWSRGVSGDVADAAYFRNELVEAARIVDKGLGLSRTTANESNAADGNASNASKRSDSSRVFARRAALLGSWDGGLGQCQFMPSNYHVYAVDKDGDGAADIWNSLPDVFASMGNFIRAYCEWDPSVRAAGFVATFEDDASLRRLVDSDAVGGFWAERRASRPAKFFAWNGVRTTHREHAPQPSSETLLLMPDGADTRSLAFLATANFRSLMRYNPSTQYAMAVSTLAQEIVDEAAEITARRNEHEKRAREAEQAKAAEAASSPPHASAKKTDASER